ncbi:hypothetical protein LWI28_000397 [Acer negundo]|uniref:Uncharacterized protein n=1 Tax=Acer negundo TaxID=4023 RepID=A0AAD5J238_ACENE|nr:hypothetical protein LWI28_000397 [Acer negundo]
MEIDEPPKVKVDREGGKPLDIVVEQLDINGFFGKYMWDSAKFVAPCTYYNYNDPVAFKVLGGYSLSAGTDDEIKEHKIMDVGPANWHKACFVPTKSDAFVTGFRRWFNKYSDGQINWGGKFISGTLPPSPPREQLMDRSCNSAYKSLNALEVILQVISIVSIGIAAATKQSAMSSTARTTMVSMAVICFAASRWLVHFIYKNFHYHDYNHALH